MLNVLIVEDNAEYRESLYLLLAARFPGVQIAEAADAEEGLRQGIAGCFDLIFMDIRLPRGNGLDLTKTIKAECPDTVICIISSFAILEYRETAFRNGADHFMIKGESTRREIIGVVESLMNASH